MKVKSLSHVQLEATGWTAAYQAPPSMGFFRQEYWSGVPLPSPVHRLVDSNIHFMPIFGFCFSKLKSHTTVRYFSIAFTVNLCYYRGFPGGSDVKSLPATWGTPVQSLGQEDSLEKGMVTHSSILAWRIPWTKEPSRLQSMRSQRVRHD